MSEDFEAQESQPVDLSRIVDLVRRRHLQFLVPLFLGWILVWGSSWFLQARYMSSTLISGRRTEHAQELCHAKRERRSASPVAKHLSADP